MTTPPALLELRHPGFIYSIWGKFGEVKEREDVLVWFSLFVRWQWWT